MTSAHITNHTSLCGTSSVGSQHDATRIRRFVCRHGATAAGAVLQAPALSSEPAGRRCCCRSMGQTDGRTDARPLHRPCSAYDAGSVNKATSVLSCRKLDAQHGAACISKWMLQQQNCAPSHAHCATHSHSCDRAGFKGEGKLGSCPGPPQLRGLHKTVKNYYLRKHKNNL